jgi:hypothetical protein
MIYNFTYIYRFIKHNKKKFIQTKRNQGQILVDFFQYKPSIIVFSYVANVLADKYQSKIILTDCNFFTIKKYFFLIFQKLFFFSNWFIYKSFGAKKLVVSKLSKFDILESEKVYNSTIKTIKKNKDILKIEVCRIKIGDLIYDDYLRHYNKATIDINSYEFKKHLLQMLQLFVFWKNYILTNKVNACLISHGVYRFGILARIAINFNIKVIQSGFGCTYSLNKKNYLTNTGYEYYPKTFKILKKKIKKNLYEIAKNELNKKLIGQTDMTEIINQSQEYKSFNTKNYFKDIDAKFKNNKIKVLVAAHLFNDAVHCYGECLFNDFYDWLDFLGQMSNKTKYEWMIKLHPADYDRNKILMKYFIDKYPKFKLIEKYTTHNQILERNNIKAVFTVYGSVGHEYPLLGVPVINACIKNPHHAYNFNINPTSRKELKKIILKIEDINFKLNTKIKKEIYEYYYTRIFADYNFLPNPKKVYFKLKHRMSTPEIFNEWLKIFDQNLHETQKNNYLKFINSNNYRMINYNPRF